MKNQDCDRLIDYLEGTLSPAEMREYEVHLESCADCQEVIEMTGELPYLSEAVEPPAGMKSRVMNAVFEEETPVPAEPIRTYRKTRDWSKLSLAAVLLLSLIGNTYAFVMLNDGAEQPEETEPLTEVTLEPSETFGGIGEAMVVRGENGELTLAVEARQLEVLQEEEVYQVWLIAEGEPMPAGYIAPDEEGAGTAYFTFGQNLENWDTVAITREPRYGNELPEGEVILSAPL